MNDNNIFTEERTAEATGEILINRAEFNEAVDKVMEKQMKDPKLTGMAALVVTLNGVAFAREMKKILFGEKDQEG